MDATTKRAFFQLHFSIFLWGFTAILGKLISVPAVVLVWWRMPITCLSLLLLPSIYSELRQLSRRTAWQLVGIGGIVLAHWLTFYGAIKLSNASVTLVCLATMSLFSAFIEPIIFRRAVKLYEVGLGLLVIPGMILIARHLDFSMLNGFLMGIASSFLGALFGTMNKKMVEKAEPLSITFVELGGGWLMLCLIIPIFFADLMTLNFVPSSLDFFYIIVLSLFCTSLPYVLSLKALRHISAFGSMLAINMEPVYGITMAWFLLGENKELTPDFYFGVLIILLSVFTYPLLKKQFEK